MKTINNCMMGVPFYCFAITKAANQSKTITFKLNSIGLC